MVQKLPQATIDKICTQTNKRYVVQIGYQNGPYETRVAKDSEYAALIHYRSYLIHSGYKKRLVDTVEGTVVERYIS